MNKCSLMVVGLVSTALWLVPQTAEAAGSNLRFQLNAPNFDKQVLTVSGDMHLKSFNDSLGLTAHFGITPGWGQLFAGPYWQATPKLYLSVGAGLRQQGTEYWGDRFGTVTKYKWSGGYLAAATEFDSRAFVHRDYRGLWYELSAAAEMAPTVNIGVRARQGIGSGGYLEVLSSTGIVPIFSWLPFNHEYRWDHRTTFDPCRGYFAVKMEF